MMYWNRFLIVFVALCIYSSVKAQEKGLFVSAHYSYNKSDAGSVVADDRPVEISKGHVVTPRLGYRLNKGWAIGGVYSFSNLRTTTSYVTVFPQGLVSIETVEKEKMYRYGIFAQRYLYDNGKTSFFMELDASKGSLKRKDGESSETFAEKKMEKRMCMVVVYTSGVDIISIKVLV